MLKFGPGRPVVIVVPAGRSTENGRAATAGASSTDGGSAGGGPAGTSGDVTGAAAGAPGAGEEGKRAGVVTGRTGVDPAEDEVSTGRGVDGPDTTVGAGLVTAVTDGGCGRFSEGGGDPPGATGATVGLAPVTGTGESRAAGGAAFRLRVSSLPTVAARAGGV